MIEGKNDEGVDIDSYELCKKVQSHYNFKISRAELERISSESAAFEFLSSVYLKSTRKIVMTFYLALVCIIHGLSVELNRNNVDWVACSVMELIVLFIIIGDIIFLQYFLVRLVNL